MEWALNLATGATAGGRPAPLSLFLPGRLLFCYGADNGALSRQLQGFHDPGRAKTLPFNLHISLQSILPARAAAGPAMRQNGLARVEWQTAQALGGGKACLARPRGHG